jgi:hypothetical protein
MKGDGGQIKNMNIKNNLQSIQIDEKQNSEL